MPGHEVFDRSGTKEADPKNTPKECDQCQYTEITVVLPGFWDTVHDASNIYSILRSNVIADAWSKLWQGFKCPPPGKECKIRKSCGAKPTFLEGGAILVKAPDTNLRWQSYVTVGRKIQCVREGREQDEEPKIPEPEEPKTPETPKKEKSPGGK